MNASAEGWEGKAAEDTTFAFLEVSLGRPEGATIAHMRLANELHRRGFKVVVYWLMETNRSLVDPGIEQRHLVHGARYVGIYGRRQLDWAMRRVFKSKGRISRHVADRFPAVQRSVMGRFLDMLLDPEKRDPGLVRRLAAFLRADGVTHVLPQAALFAPMIDAAIARSGVSARQLITSWGDELPVRAYGGDGEERRLLDFVRQTLERAETVPVTVSFGYRDYLADLLGGERLRQQVIYPPVPQPAAGAGGGERLRRFLPALRDDRPLLSFIGRFDCEKGVDLFLYALRILRARGHEVQAAVFGAPVWDTHYANACRQLARNLDLDVAFPGPIVGEDRDALYATSHCIVYPSIHCEAFGMVAAEALSFGTPAVVPDRGGLPEAIGDGERWGGLTFRPWDSGHLADQIERLLVDRELYRQLSENARPLAARFAVADVTDALLTHWKLPRRPAAGAPAQPVLR